MPSPRTGSRHGRLRFRSFGVSHMAKPRRDRCGFGFAGALDLPVAWALSPKSPGKPRPEQRMCGCGAVVQPRACASRRPRPGNAGAAIAHAIPGLSLHEHIATDRAASEPPPGIEPPSEPRLCRNGDNAPPGHSPNALPPFLAGAMQWRPRRSRRSVSLPKAKSPGSPPDDRRCANGAPRAPPSRTPARSLPP